jgi:hypothetical protein
MNVLSPLAAGRPVVRALAPRRAGLRGARIGVLDNSKPNADALLGRVAELLAAGAGDATIRHWRKPGSSRPAAVLEEIAGAVDVLLTGSAD